MIDWSRAVCLRKRVAFRTSHEALGKFNLRDYDKEDALVTPFNPLQVVCSRFFRKQFSPSP